MSKGVLAKCSYIRRGFQPFHLCLKITFVLHSFCEFEDRILITLFRSFDSFIFYKVCFWSAIQFPIQRRGRIIHLHPFFCFKSDHAYRLAVIVCPAMFNAVILLDLLTHVSTAQDFFGLFELQLLLHVALMLLLFNRKRVGRWRSEKMRRANLRSFRLAIICFVVLAKGV